MQNNSQNTNCIRTFTGLELDPLLPDPDMINIVDIAHALSFIPRFGGHCQRFFSVAEHSLFTYENVKDAFPGDFKLQLAGLMHDASEAYLCDIPTPVKQRIKGYLIAEERLMKVIAMKFGFDYPLNDIIHSCDKYSLRLEWESLMKTGSHYVIPTDTFFAVETRFIKVFDILTNKL
jgi:hypothetical protein